MNRETERRYHAFFEAIDEGFCVVEVRLSTEDTLSDYRVIEANQAFYDNTGFPKDILGQWLRDALPGLEAHWFDTYEKVALSRESKRFTNYSDALNRHFDVYAFPVGEEAPLQVAILFKDITEKTRLEEQTQLLIQELNHRSKNVLTLVQSIARQTARSSTDNFLDVFDARLKALATAQDVLIANAGESTRVAELVESKLAHFSSLFDDRIHIEGPPADLQPNAAQVIGMALHELATNAAKYGALSDDNGRVSITWSLDTHIDPEPQFRMHWVEQDGPPVKTPGKTGFGTTVTKRLLEASTKGEVVIDFAEHGVSWAMTVPASSVLVSE